MSAGGRLRALFVGLGAIGQRHLRNLRQVWGPGLELLAYRVRGRGHVLDDALRVASENGLEDHFGIRLVPDLEAGLAETPDVVFVTNPSSAHLDVALAAARAGCHIFVEKPLATREDGLEELAQIVERKGLLALVGYQLRFHPGFARMRELLDGGRPGPIVGVRAVVGESLAGAHPYEDYRESYAARPELGGGVLFGFVHELDYLQAWFGPPRRVFAMGGHLSRLEVGVEDVASVLMELAPAGARPFPAHVHLDYVQRPPLRRCEVLGEEGRLSWDLGELSVEDVRSDGSVERFATPDLERNAPFLEEMRHWVRCLRGEEPPRVGIREAAASVATALAAHRSLEAGAPVSLPGGVAGVGSA